jgi:putative tryptophan/tyrosine transport system substrate-binding protein
LPWALRTRIDETAIIDSTGVFRMEFLRRRRDFITLLGGAAAAWPLVAHAQQPERMRRIGIVMPFAKGDSEGEARIRAFKQELARLGWTDGNNIQFDERWPADNMDLVRSHAASLVASNPDIIVASGGRIVPVLMRLTRSIPIVLPGATDPVGVGWAHRGRAAMLPVSPLSSSRC